MIEFHQKRNLVGVFARDRAERAERGGHRIAAALDGEPDDVFRVKVFGIRRKTGPGRVFDALVHREDGQIARAGQSAMIENLGQAPQHRRRAVALGVNPVNEIRPGQMEPVPGNGFAMVFEQALRAVAQQLFEFGMHS